eukprot:TRINITY_DN21254_c0_g1_i1.p1 TRINITY_DN21254_c0_g1~~TRINITY_DN21254_c0_g1_i1.p1  ORF type:complete len:107 (-),score=1.23 TRINITY_DN21254_c0_g1_i1:80-400(-)
MPPKSKTKNQIVDTIRAISKHPKLTTPKNKCRAINCPPFTDLAKNQKNSMRESRDKPEKHLIIAISPAVIISVREKVASKDSESTKDNKNHTTLSVATPDKMTITN